MDVSPLRQGEKLAGQEVTRCLGNYRLKAGYREDERLRACCAEPALAEPDMVSVQLDESCRFLLLLSRGLYRALEEVRDEPQVNKEVAQLVVEEVRLRQDSGASLGDWPNVDRVLLNHYFIVLTMCVLFACLLRSKSASTLCYAHFASNKDFGLSGLH